MIKGLVQSAKDFLNNYKNKNPSTYAAAQQAVGAVLILDGITGIDNPLDRRRGKRQGLFGALITIPVALIFIAVGIFIPKLTNIDKMTATTTAEVLEVTESRSRDSDGNTSVTCSLQVEYTVAGKQYRSRSPISSSSFCSKSVGGQIEIYYDESNPNSWTADKMLLSLLPTIFLIIGIILLLTGIITSAIRLVCIVIGWKMITSGRALAKTLPGETNWSTIIAEIKQNFIGSVLNFGGTKETNTTATHSTKKTSTSH